MKKMPPILSIGLFIDVIKILYSFNLLMKMLEDVRKRGQFMDVFFLIAPWPLRYKSAGVQLLTLLLG